MHKTLILISLLITMGLADNAKAFCWRSVLSGHSVFYACFGPDQMSQSYYDSLDDALFASGCELAKVSDSTMIREGIKNGTWIDCQIPISFGMHTPTEIKAWLDSKKITK